MIAFRISSGSQISRPDAIIRLLGVPAGRNGSGKDEANV